MQGGKNSSSIKVTSKREGKSIHHGLIPSYRERREREREREREESALPIQFPDP